MFLGRQELNLANVKNNILRGFVYIQGADSNDGLFCKLPGIDLFCLSIFPSIDCGNNIDNR